jgi:hemerythrin-like domain-containing protein
MNAIDLLKQQHEKVKKTLTKMSEGAPTSASAIETLANELVAHMVIEEHIFYPRVKEAMKDLINESFEEHAVARFELARLIQAAGPEKKTRATVLLDIIDHHVEEEETEMFPKVKKALSKEELEDLGARMEAAFEKAVARGYAVFFPTYDPSATTRNAPTPSLHAH